MAALLEAAGEHRVLLTTAILAGGLRVSKLTGLRWRDVNLAAGRLRVAASKTAAGVREVDLSPELRELLTEHRARSVRRRPRLRLPDEEGHPSRPQRVRARVLRPAIERANTALSEREREPIPAGLTLHSLRHTYASLMAEAGVDAAYAMAQMGHADARMTLGVYTHVGNRRKAGNARLDTLIGGADWARMGTSGAGAKGASSEARPPRRPIPLSQAKGSQWSLPGSNRRPPACERASGMTPLFLVVRRVCGPRQCDRVPFGSVSGVEHLGNGPVPIPPVAG